VSVASPPRTRHRLHGALHGTPRERARWLRRWLIVGLTGFALALVPWAIHLAYSLPSRHVTTHWDVAWVGFDVLEALAVLATVAALFLGSSRLSIISASAGTLLVCDAWFDVATARPGRELAVAILSAAAAELPLAALLFWLANDARLLEHRR
jgi:hypothetical protein